MCPQPITHLSSATASSSGLPPPPLLPPLPLPLLPAAHMSLPNQRRQCTRSPTTDKAATNLQQVPTSKYCTLIVGRHHYLHCLCNNQVCHVCLRRAVDDSLQITEAGDFGAKETLKHQSGDNLVQPTMRKERVFGAQPSPAI